ncbi:MAG: NADH-quinone oxidoreductase subunit NuoE [Sedimentibacter sp.]|uniref:NADH-quinone oxidoreductase subunit NuoE n=1 Tax=Sedimentibacter sp. TaxID=1960295 RepID=UPI003159070A
MIDSSIDIMESNELDVLLRKYPCEKRFTLAILQDVQKHYGYIPREVMQLVADYLRLPVSEIYSMATFYKALSLKAKGKHIIKVCNGTACHIRGANMLIDEVAELLDISPGETTEDGLFSIEIVNCLGACALAPVMVIDDKYYGKMTRDKVKSVIDEYRRASHEQ